MSPEVIAIVASALTIAGLILREGRRAAQDRKSAATDRKSAAEERAAIRADLRHLERDLGQRLARLEGAFAYLRPPHATAPDGK